MCMNIKTSLQQSQKWLVALLLLAGSITSYAQSECFTYDKDVNTIITGLTGAGQAATSLTIPKEVTVVNSGAFTQANSLLTSLYVENDGNPAFKSGLFGENSNTLTMIDMGDAMSVPNMIALLQSVGTFNTGTTIVADGFSGIRDNTDDTWDDVTWTNVASITLPAQLIADQEFGDAQVYGRFTINNNKEIISFCTTANFFDEDDGSNMLFYIADKIADDGRLHIQRVLYVAYGEGILIHNKKNTSTYADLLRVSSIPTAQLELYSTNMLKGVITDTNIESTSANGTRTNYILKDGAFHPTRGGIIKANKAYLQILTSAARETLTISFDDESTGVKEVNGVKDVNDDSYFDLQGRKVAQPTKGLYIMNGKKYVIR